MPTRYQPALDLRSTIPAGTLVSRIWDRDIGAWGARTRQRRREVHRHAARLARHRRNHAAPPRAGGCARRIRPGGEDSRPSTCWGWAAAACVRRSSGPCSASPKGSPALRPRHDRRADTPHSGCPHDARPKLVPGCQQERRHRRSVFDGAAFLVTPEPRARGARRPSLHRDYGCRDRAQRLWPESRGYREVFINPADIGGRFSALSLFGLVPAALIGAIGLRPALAPAKRWPTAAGRRTSPILVWSSAPSSEPRRRTGGTSSRRSCPRRSPSLGLWIEQLIAESTGKRGKGALPVVDEALGRPDEYSADRAFVAITTDRDTVDAHRLAATRGGRAIQCCT